MNNLAGTRHVGAEHKSPRATRVEHDWPECGWVSLGIIWYQFREACDSAIVVKHLFATFSFRWKLNEKDNFEARKVIKFLAFSESFSSSTSRRRNELNNQVNKRTNKQELRRSDDGFEGENRGPERLEVIQSNRDNNVNIVLCRVQW